MASRDEFATVFRMLVSGASIDLIVRVIELRSLTDANPRRHSLEEHLRNSGKTVELKCSGL
jgi:hypothetical protein